MEEIWNNLYNEAKKVLKPRKVSEMMDYENGKIKTLGELTPDWWI